MKHSHAVAASLLPSFFPPGFAQQPFGADRKPGEYFAIYRGRKTGEIEGAIGDRLDRFRDSRSWHAVLVTTHRS